MLFSFVQFVKTISIAQMHFIELIPNTKQFTNNLPHKIFNKSFCISYLWRTMCYIERHLNCIPCQVSHISGAYSLCKLQGPWDTACIPPITDCSLSYYCFNGFGYFGFVWLFRHFWLGCTACLPLPCFVGRCPLSRLV